MAATANIKAGKAYVEVTAETSRFRKNLAGAEKVHFFNGVFIRQP